MKKVLLIGGGTGGHILPLKNLTECLEGHGAQVHLVVADQTLDRNVVEDNFTGVRVHYLKCGKIRRYFSLRNFSDVFVIMSSVLKARRLLKDIKPDVIFLF